jgi:hypothetical protein
MSWVAEFVRIPALAYAPNSHEFGYRVIISAGLLGVLVHRELEFLPVGVSEK